MSRMQGPWELLITVDKVIRAQGGDPEAWHEKKPYLIEKILEAIAIGQPLLKPVVFYRVLKVTEIRDHTIFTEDNGFFSSEILAKHMANAQWLTLIVSTVSTEISDLSRKVLDEDPILSVNLDAFGTAALDELGFLIRERIIKDAKEKGLKVSMPLNPGIQTWPLAEGQKQIFSMMPEVSEVIRLNPSFLMLPFKSVSYVIGIGENVKTDGHSCDYCPLPNVCYYHGHNSAQRG